MPVKPAPTLQPLREFWGYFSANKGAMAGLVIVVIGVAGRRICALAGTLRTRPHQQPPS
jgi:hypothetical protein